jgi:DNA transformation protein and related proteins
MATRQETIDFILDQVASAGEARVQKMFGEYALYLGDKVVALVCDDQLFVKITEPGRVYVGERYEEGYAYPGAKVSMHIPEEMFDDREWLTELLRVTAEALPEPKPKNKKKSDT